MTKDEQIAKLTKERDDLLALNKKQNALVDRVAMINHELIRRLEEATQVVANFKAEVDKQVAEKMAQLPVKGTA